MQIKSFIHNSLIDYDGKVSSLIFLPGCNYKCPSCHNRQLVLEPEVLETVDERTVISYLRARQGWIDAVVISGGEPTLHKDLPDLCKKIKDWDYLIKIDTNGSEPLMLEHLIQDKLVDYIAMDIKTSLDIEKYSRATGVNINDEDIAKIKQSIELVKVLDNYEFRVTCVPGIVTKDDLINIAHYLNTIHANKSFYLQQFRPENLINSELETLKPYSKEEMQQFQYSLNPYFKKVGLRGV